jgi:hypothetical protein
MPNLVPFITYNPQLLSQADRNDLTNAGWSEQRLGVSKRTSYSEYYGCATNNVRGLGVCEGVRRARWMDA